MHVTRHKPELLAVALLGALRHDRRTEIWPHFNYISTLDTEQWLYTAAERSPSTAYSLNVATQLFQQLMELAEDVQSLVGLLVAAAHRKHC